MKIKVKYFDNEIDKIKKISKGNWIDLRAAETVHLKKGEFHLIPLGVGMKLPNGYEAHVVPRSSTFKNFGIIQTNHMGVIDGGDKYTGEGGYCGDNDQWFFPALAMRDLLLKSTSLHLSPKASDILSPVYIIRTMILALFPYNNSPIFPFKLKPTS